jgi:pyruvate dehydrogenase complex dehydrogenase (E1) component
MTDIDPAETQEWRDALATVLEFDGEPRTKYLLDQLLAEAQRLGARVPFVATTPYVNTVAVQDEPTHPGDREIEHRIRSVIRWNALAMVLRANKESTELGGHISSFQSAATLYDVGFQHFWHAPSEGHGGDLVFIQGHSSPGIYARAFLEGRLVVRAVLLSHPRTVIVDPLLQHGERPIATGLDLGPLLSRQLLPSLLRHRPPLGGSRGSLSPGCGYRRALPS